MALSYYFSEPFYSLTDFNRLFDEAFASRTENGQVQRQNGNNGEARSKVLRPK
jgi:HSP20 family protein